MQTFLNGLVNAELETFGNGLVNAEIKAEFQMSDKENSHEFVIIDLKNPEATNV